MARARTSSPRLKKPTVATQSVRHYEFEASAVPELHLIDSGSRFKVARLEAHATNVLPKVKKNPGFADLGFGSDWVEGIRGLVRDVKAGVERKNTLKDGALPTGVALDHAIADAKQWRRRANTIIRLTHSLVAHHATRGTGSSVALLESSIRERLPIIANSATEKRGGGAAMRARGESILAQLSSANEAHKTALAALSPELRALNAKKGLLYEELKSLGIAARDVAPAESKLFAVGTHVRTPGSKAKKPSKSSPSASAATATATA